MNAEDTQFKFSELPQTFNIEVAKVHVAFNLQAVIAYTGQKNTRRSNSSVGHFVSFCRRPNNTWSEYDDTSDKEKPKANKHKCNPQILIYVRQ